MSVLCFIRALTCFILCVLFVGAVDLDVLVTQVSNNQVFVFCTICLVHTKLINRTAK